MTRAAPPLEPRCALARRWWWWTTCMRSASSTLTTEARTARRVRCDSPHPCALFTTASFPTLFLHPLAAGTRSRWWKWRAPPRRRSPVFHARCTHGVPLPRDAGMLAAWQPDQKAALLRPHGVTTLPPPPFNGSIGAEAPPSHDVAAPPAHPDAPSVLRWLSARHCVHYSHARSKTHLLMQVGGEAAAFCARAAAAARQLPRGLRHRWAAQVPVRAARPALPLLRGRTPLLYHYPASA